MPLHHLRGELVSAGIVNFCQFRNSLLAVRPHRNPVVANSVVEQIVRLSFVRLHAKAEAIANLGVTFGNKLGANRAVITRDASGPAVSVLENLPPAILLTEPIRGRVGNSQPAPWADERRSENAHLGFAFVVEKRTPLHRPQRLDHKTVLFSDDSRMTRPRRRFPFAPAHAANQSREQRFWRRNRNEITGEQRPELVPANLKLGEIEHGSRLLANRHRAIGSNRHFGIGHANVNVAGRAIDGADLDHCDGLRRGKRLDRAWQGRATREQWNGGDDSEESCFHCEKSVPNRMEKQAVMPARSMDA